MRPSWKPAPALSPLPTICLQQKTEIIISPFTTQSQLLATLWERSLLKTLWEKEKMLATSIFSFFQKVFYPSYEEFPFLSYNYFFFFVCKGYQFGPVQNLSFSKELRNIILSTAKIDLVCFILSVSIPTKYRIPPSDTQNNPHPNFQTHTKIYPSTGYHKPLKHK